MSTDNAARTAGATICLQYSVVGEITPTERNYKVVCGIAGCDWKAYKHSHMHAEKALAVHSAMTHADVRVVHRSFGEQRRLAMSKGTVAAVCCQCGATDLVVLGAGVIAPSNSTLLLCPKCAPKFLDNWTANWSVLKFDGPWGDRIRRRAEQLGLIDKAAAHQ